MIESEKVLEKKLGDKIKKLGGLSLKLLSKHFTGLPDRVCLLPGGILFFVEIKTTKKKATKIQLYVHKQLQKLGFEVYIVDTSIQIKELLSKYEKIT
jgi:hypothetical protein